MTTDPGREITDSIGAELGMRPFERSLPMALMRAREASMQTFRPILAEHGLTEQQWRVLRALGDRRTGFEVGGLAAATFLLGPSLSRILVNLEERDLVTRSPVAHDARRSLISLSDAGIELVRRVAPRSEQAYNRIEDRFGPGRVAELLDLLDDLAALPPAFDDPEETTS